MKNLGLLPSFVEAVESGSFTEAARKLALTPATVSRNIARLEEELGTRLFHRTTRVLHLTDDGRLYFEDVKSALRVIEESEAMLLSASSRPAGIVRVAMPVPFSATYVLPRLRRFLDANDRISIEIDFEDNQVDPVKDGYDLVIRNGAPPDGTHIIRKLCEERQVLVASPDYLAASGTPTRPEELADHLCIAHRTPSSQTLAWKLLPLDAHQPGHPPSLLYDPHTRLRVCGHAQGGVNAALSGLGIAAMSFVHVYKLVEDGQLRIVMPDFEFVDDTGLAKIYAVYPNRKFLLPKVRLFLDFLAQAVGEEEAAMARATAGR